jgi:hypothetical protein
VSSSSITSTSGETQQPALTTFTMSEISLMRVRDIKWYLARRHGYGADEISRMLDKKELIESLAFEEEKIRLTQEAKWKRQVLMKGLLWSLVAVTVVIFWPLLCHGYDVVSVNILVYTDRKRYEAQVCRELQSISGVIGFTLMFVLDLLQLWLTVSVTLSWFVRRSKYFFPTPSLSVRPGQFMGEGVARSQLGSYGVNIGPMVITWAMRFVHGKLEAWTGRALVSAQREQRRRARQAAKAQTPEERAARKEAKRRAVEDEVARQEAKSTAQPPVNTFQSDWVEPSTSSEAGVEPIHSKSHQEFLNEMEELHTSAFDELD